MGSQRKGLKIPTWYILSIANKELLFWNPLLLTTLAFHTVQEYFTNFIMLIDLLSFLYLFVHSFLSALFLSLPLLT